MMMGTALRAFAHPTDFLQRLGVLNKTDPFPEWASNDNSSFHNSPSGVEGKGKQLIFNSPLLIHLRFRHPSFPGII